jgi:translation initiation factor 2B subunit (eIF-2B alpha/beta/delta family)
MIVTHSEDTRIVISWKNIGFMDKENKMLSFPFIENYLTQMKKIQGDKERKKKILTEDADPQRKEKKEMLYEYIQAILMNFFNNDESLTHLHSRDKMSFFKMNSLSGPSHKIYVLQLPF